MERKIKEELIASINSLIKERNIENFSALDIREINIKPHTPVIGTKTMQYADHNSGIIDDDAPCCYENCNLKIKEHHGDTVMFFNLSGTVNKGKVGLLINEIYSELEKHKIDGVTFVQKNEECTFA
jgi:hypothetical protein